MNLAAARAKFLSDLESALEEALNHVGSPKPVVIVSAPGGIGKTLATAQLLSQQRVTWFGERNAMIVDISGFHAAPIPGLAPIPGSAHAPPTLEKRMSRADSGACSQYAKRVLPLVNAQLGRHIEALACRGCPDRKVCVYKNWKPTTDWLFAPHVWLGLQVDHKPLFLNRDIVVIDESPLPVMLGKTSLQAWEITEILQALRRIPVDDVQVGAIALTEIFAAAENLLTIPPKRERVALRELAKDLGYQFVSRVGPITLKPQLAAPLPPITSTALATNPLFQQVRKLITYLQKQAGGEAVEPGLKAVLPRDIAQVVLRLTWLPNELRAKLAPLADALAADVGPRPACVVVLPVSGSTPGIAAGHFKPLPVPDDIPLVILDATADVASRYWFTLTHRAGKLARPVLTVDVDVDLAATIFQTVNYRYPSSTFKGSNTAINRLMDIVDVYKKNNLTKVVGVIVKKSDFDNDTGFRKRVLQSLPPKNIGYFWALRGDNSMQNIDALFVVGAPELSSLEAEALARAYMSNIPPRAGEVPFNYQPTTTTVNSTLFTTLTDRHGREISVEERGYPELEPFLAWRLFHHDEYIQALLRARPYDPAKKKEIFFLSSTLLTTIPVTYVKEEDLLGIDLWVRAKEVVDQNCARRLPALTQRALASLLGVVESTVSKARRKDPKSWALLGF